MKKNKSDGNVRVLWNNEVAPLYFNMGLSGNNTYKNATPGQFVMLHADDRLTPLLRRPFSIHRINKSDDGSVVSIEILYKVVGESTKVFSELKKGSTLNLLGPLGKGFEWNKSNHRIFIAGGGIGLAPLVFLAMELKFNSFDPANSLCFIGGRTKDDILCVDDFEKLGLPVRISSDDGSIGEKGLITDLLIKAIDEEKPDIIYTCGPHPMLKAVSELARENGINCQVSVETMMACGMGACLGCAMEGADGAEKFKHACVDGPVFDSGDIKM